jgi:hypothetical protein
MIMDTEMKHEDMGNGHKGPHMHEGHHHRLWQNNWKSPVSLGIFLLTASLSLAILLYTVLNLVGVIAQVLHPAASQGMTQQELQQLMQSQGSQSAPSGTTGQ